MISRKTDAVAILAILLITQLGCTQNKQDAVSSLDENLSFQIIHNAPAEGNKTLADFRKQWLLVNFWSVSCPPCFEEIPDLARADTELNNPSITVIGVAMAYDRPDVVLQTARDANIPYLVSLDLKREIEKAFSGITVIPTSFLINPDGLPIKKYTGTVTFKQIQKDLNQFNQTYLEKE